MTEMNIHQILDAIPHRYPFILVDKVLEIEEGTRIVAVKNVTMNEPYFTGHFPGMPVMPGVLIIEAMAQASILLHSTVMTEEEVKNTIHYFAGIDNARFKQIVEPGDQLIMEVTLTKHKRDITKAYGEASVDGKVVCSADLMSIKRTIER